MWCPREFFKCYGLHITRFTKSVVEKLFLLKIICVINFRGFHCPRKFLTTNYFQSTVYHIYCLSFMVKNFCCFMSLSLFHETSSYYNIRNPGAANIIPRIIIIYLQCNDTVLNRATHKTYQPCSMSRQYITKQLEYITKDHIVMHIILFMLKTALFFSFLVV